MVRINFWSSPLSPSALRAALMTTVSASISDTTRPPQTGANRSSLLDDTIAVLQKIDQEVENLRLDYRDTFLTPMQLSPFGVKPTDDVDKNASVLILPRAHLKK